MVKARMDATIWLETYGNGVPITMIRIIITCLLQRILRVQNQANKGLLGVVDFFTLDIMRGVLRVIGYPGILKVRKLDFAVQKHQKNDLLI